MARKKTAPNSDLKPTTMRPANGGLLRVGNPGNRGGTGRPSNRIREMAQQGMDVLMPHLIKLGTKAARESDQIAACLGVAKIAVPNQVEVGENPDNPILTPEEREARLKAWLDQRGT